MSKLSYIFAVNLLQISLMLLKKLFFTIAVCFIFILSNAENNKIEVVYPDILVESVQYKIEIKTNSNTEFNTDNLITLKNNVSLPITSTDNQKYIETSFTHGDQLIIQYQNEVIYSSEPNPIPLWFSILPPLIAIIMALITKEVFSSLFIGLLVGTTVIFKYKGFSFFLSLGKGLFAVVDTYALQALNNPDHLSIIIFSMLIGGMVALITMNGGMKGIVYHLAKYAKSPRSGQFITWLMGLIIFFDDYANTLVVGNTMRPVTDKLKISREKLSYLVDSTSAPIASIAFITTWIGAELSYINEGINHLGIDQSAYQIFLSSLSYSFYPIFTIGFVLMLIIKNRDFGPMYKMEVKARKIGIHKTQDSGKHAQILSEFETSENVKARWYNAFIPVVVVVLGTIIGLVYTGWDANTWYSDNISFTSKLSVIIGNADSFKALMWSSLIGVLVSIALSTIQKVLTLKESMEGLVNGFKTMFNAVLILILAWSIALITEHMHTATFITEILRVVKVSPYWIPALAFIFSGFIAFSTGSSWGTMAIIYPLILPACWKICVEYGFSTDQIFPIFYNVVSTVLAGSVLGDHCSPISDTTILSSLASSCNHLNHVKTQMPYALLVGGVSLLIGTIPGAFGIPTWSLFIIGFLILYFIIVKFGKKVEV